jgi:hypothetical protein
MIDQQKSQRTVEIYLYPEEFSWQNNANASSAPKRTPEFIKGEVLIMTLRQFRNIPSSDKRVAMYASIFK